MQGGTYVGVATSFSYLFGINFSDRYVVADDATGMEHLVKPAHRNFLGASRHSNLSIGRAVYVHAILWAGIKAKK